MLTQGLGGLRCSVIFHKEFSGTSEILWACAKPANFRSTMAHTLRHAVVTAEMDSIDSAVEYEP